MGHGEYDDSRQVLKLEQPSLNTTRRLITELNHTDLVIHIGDLSYADGYGAAVRGAGQCWGVVRGGSWAVLGCGERREPGSTGLW